MKFRKPRFKNFCTEPDIPDINTESEEDNLTSYPNTKKAKFGWGWRSVYIFFGISAVIYLIAILSEGFSDFFNRYIGAVVRYVLAIPSNIFPFSLAETMLILLLPTLVGVLIIACRWHCGSWRNVWAFSGKLFSFALILLILFIWGFGTGYHGSTLDKKLGIDKQNVSELELHNTVEYLTLMVNRESENIEYSENGFSEMPYSLDEMNSKLLEAFDTISKDYSFIPRMKSRIKPVMMSELMSYTHITGVYSFFTGEANINVAFPDYTIPFTAAHELAHQRGTAREDEANFVAFLVCIASDDAYIRYSGYLNMLEFVTSAYYRAVNGNTHIDFASFLKLVDKYDNVKAALEDYQTASGITVNSYSLLIAAMNESEGLNAVLLDVSELTEALGYYNNRVESVNRYNSLRNSLNISVRNEQVAYNNFYEKYRDSVVSKITGAVNNTYLQLQGTAGTASYGMVVDLAVAYYKK